MPDKLPMRVDCIFDLASVTKLVATGIAFGICVDDGRLRFDMPIARALPDLCGRGIEPNTAGNWRRRPQDLTTRNTGSERKATRCCN